MHYSMRCLLLALAVRAASGQQRLFPTDFPGISEAFFENRSFAPRYLNVLNQRFSDLTVDKLRALQLDYASIVNRTLTIRDTKVVDNCDFQHEVPPDPPQCRELGSWTFPKLIAQSLQVVGYKGSAEDALHGVTFSGTNFNRRWSYSDKRRPLAIIPLRLLAVVNRFDLAHQSGSCPAGLICGAEFRFDYAGIVEPAEGPDGYVKNPFFTLILEFVLPPMDLPHLRDAARPWAELYKYTDPDQYRRELEKVLAGAFDQWSHSKKPYARIRASGRGGDDGDWTFSQFRLTNTGFEAKPLDEQFSDYVATDECVSRESLLGEFLAAPANQQTVLTTIDYEFFQKPIACPSGHVLAACQASTDFDPPSVITLSSSAAPGVKNLDELRYDVSIGSCTGCHGHETQGKAVDNTDPYAQAPNPIDFTHFDQLKYRNSRETSRLSRFLAGGEGGEPLLPPRGEWEVDPTPVVAGCHANPQNRFFNDLWRRFVFEFLLLTPIRSGGTYYPWSYFSANGLAARQPH